MSERGQVFILHAEWCKGCGICIEVCPTEVFALENEKITIKQLENCLGCQNCELVCPDFVLKVVDNDD